MKTVLRLSLFLFCFSIHVFSQNRNADSLRQLIRVSKNDTVKARLLNKLGWEFKGSAPDSTIGYCRQALNLALKGKCDKQCGQSYTYIGTMEMYKGNYDTAIQVLSRALPYETKEPSMKAVTLLYIGTAYQKKGAYKEALDQYLQALRIQESLKDSVAMATIHNSMGNLYYLQQNIDKALEEFNTAFALAEHTGNKKIVADCLNNLGIIYNVKGDINKALDYFTRSCDIRKELGLLPAVARTLSNIGSLYAAMGNFEKALACQTEALQDFELIGDREAMSAAMANMGELYVKKGDLASAESIYFKSLALAQEIGSKEDIMTAYESLASLYGKKMDFKKAYEYEQLYSSTKDSLINEQNSEQINEMQTKYETEKKQEQIRMLEKDNQLSQLELDKKESDIRRQNIILGCGAAGLVLVLLLAFFIYRGYRQKKRSNEQLQVAYRLVEEKNVIVEEKNKEITDSITYAKRIQQALFASESTISADYPEHFILYKPKDIVSGDFYWAYRALTKNNEKRLMLCVGDCTGHGVPGAFMSLLGISFLNQTVVEKKILHPNLAFNVLRDEIERALNKEDDASKAVDGSGVQDGMDAVLCAFDPEKMALSFACANNPLWILRHDKNEIEEFKPDKFPLGKYTGEKKSFRLQNTPVQKGDTVYLFTDGYADQFGGPDGKKFKYKQMEELLVSLKGKPMPDQKKALAESIEKWKGNLEQVDDILIIGIRI